MALLEISVVPVGTSSASFSSHVTQAIQAIEEAGLPYQITPTATVIEGEVDELLHLAGVIHQNALSQGTQRVITHMSLDHRVDKPTELTQPMEAVFESME
ncbi:MAG: MTH1187 family thiamine-binding protein [Firmicutes bacterium]|nr:MTH1187 family thiamine-binding protein [Bacillota bacterium]